MATVPKIPVSDPYSLLAGLASPDDVRGLAPGELPELAAQMRAFLVGTVCATGGHLGPNLGVVELTLALHRVFDSPRDALVFDTGHQSYVHKLVTGRMRGFDRPRQAGGLSGYPARAESVHDVVENSHASTALSYADGLAKARQLTGETQRAVVAVIGDGAMTGGLAWEALNNLGTARDRPVIVVLNDNGRSYAPTTGALATHLRALRTGTRAGERRNVFTDLGFTYFGPVDGHDIPALEAALRSARALERPVVVHVHTVKGKGYEPAELDVVDCLHAVGTVDPATGRPSSSMNGAAGVPKRPSWTSVFSQHLVELAEQRPELVGVTASMLRPTGLHPMAVRFPERVFDVGIAEQHAVTSAAGLAIGGFHPVVAIYASFLNRAFDQVLMDVALHRLPVTFVLDRAGITGPDGASHHGMWDLSVFSTAPGLRIAAPRDGVRLIELLDEAVCGSHGPTMLRIPKGSVAPELRAIGQADGIDILYRSRHRSRDVLIVGVGPMAEPACKAAVELAELGARATVVDPRWVHPISPTLVELAARHRLVVTVEDNLRASGVGTGLLAACQDAGLDTRVIRLGLPAAFLPHDDRDTLLEHAGLTAESIVKAVLDARSGAAMRQATIAARVPTRSARTR
ncbi:1-deoxy-D-xylulose-5-phosphate synthase [Streptomyces lavendulae]|uniref:1-deoxy-D-xylulose-5-phosphate synthase n=1 Tax=Streptomyces lavendulae TaxID=1914 RepID=UPI0024A2D0CC|nr:1-deoxy-D-xylulose-5-phosphate synthase [Streptomyces lavendulae]GLW04529.1 1-deoxy-D-xylulose-5-phosphate synthase [Streptomyces lavendulae subsp. lavendulae]